MKKGLTILAGALVVLSSCGSVDYKPAAEKMCKCMTEKETNRDPNALLGEDFDYASCAFDVIIETRTDINNDNFGKILESECSELKRLHDDYLATINE